jgi:hypothetical protein
MAFPPLVPAVATEHQIGTQLSNGSRALTTLKNVAAFLVHLTGLDRLAILGGD